MRKPWKRKPEEIDDDSDGPATTTVAKLVYKHTCQQCGYRWESGKDGKRKSDNSIEPRQCRNCNSRRWDGWTG